MARSGRVFAALVLSVLVTVLCAVTVVPYVACYAVGGAWRGLREVATAWWAFARLPWAA